ncbi:hypothetical protein L6452_08674 [Arctium lappa]|uniref:Uncharacterized protein n=1 Tax=Arctium lappa TaxID=4217 RepID=A0ACB9DI86_ARCLA|nr:hypothetical protein L6452_08674 [Arctium lappa]
MNDCRCLEEVGTATTMRRTGDGILLEWGRLEMGVLTETNPAVEEGSTTPLTIIEPSNGGFNGMDVVAYYVLNSGSVLIFTKIWVASILFRSICLGLEQDSMRNSWEVTGVSAYTKSLRGRASLYH